MIFECLKKLHILLLFDFSFDLTFLTHHFVFNFAK